MCDVLIGMYDGYDVYDVYDVCVYVYMCDG